MYFFPHPRCEASTHSEDLRVNIDTERFFLLLSHCTKRLMSLPSLVFARDWWTRVVFSLLYQTASTENTRRRAGRRREARKSAWTVCHHCISSHCHRRPVCCCCRFPPELLHMPLFLPSGGRFQPQHTKIMSRRTRRWWELFLCEAVRRHAYVQNDSASNKTPIGDNVYRCHTSLEGTREICVPVNFVLMAVGKQRMAEKRKEERNLHWRYKDVEITCFQTNTSMCVCVRVWHCRVL